MRPKETGQQINGESAAAAVDCLDRKDRKREARVQTEREEQFQTMEPSDSIVSSIIMQKKHINYLPDKTIFCGFY